MIERGAVGSGPPDTRVSDVVCAFPECPFPFLIRPGDRTKGSTEWNIVGPSWVDGMMNWEPENEIYRITMRDHWKTERKVEEIILS